MKRGGIVLVVVVAALMAAGPASAAVITVYTNQAAWEAAVGGMFETETFDGLPVTTPLAANTTHALGLVEFEYPGAPDIGSYDDDLPAITGDPDREFQGSVYQATWGGGDTKPGPHEFTFPYDVMAFGADFRTTTSGAMLTATMAGETIAFDDYLADPGTGFLGVVSDTPFTTVVFDADGGGYTNEQFYMDDLSFSNIPEPATLSLLGLGALGLVRRRRRS